MAITGQEFLEQYAATYRFSLGRPKNIAVTPGGEAVLFLRSGPRSFVQDLFEFDCKTGRERVLLTADKVLGGAEEHLTAEELARRERMRLASRGIASYTLSEDGEKVLVPLSGRLFVVERASGRVQELKTDAGYPIDPQLTKDGDKLACVRDGEVFVTDLATGKEHRLTTGAGGPVTNGLAEFVAQEEMGRFHGFWWSPDGAAIAYQQTDVAGVEVFHIADPTKPESEPALWPYPRPGKKNADVKLGVMSAAGGETIWVKWDREKYPYLAHVTWQKNSPLCILVQNREQTEQLLLAVDHATGDTTTLIQETDPAWLNIFESCPKWLDDGSAFLWLTESRGAKQLELRSRDGARTSTITDPAFGLVDVLDLDHERGIVTVAASDDPTTTHLWRLSLDPARGVVTPMTQARGHHGAVFAKNHGVYVHSFNLATGEYGWNVGTTEGKKLGSLTSVAEKPAFTPAVELTTVDELKLLAAIIRPRGFVPGRKYPVIASVYTGPGSLTVTSTPTSYLLQQWLADQGFIVVLIDNRGTPRRGREWERAWKSTGKGNLIDVALEDQTSGLKALGAKYREMDMTRVGVTGWSFGGYYAAMAVMRRPDVYKAGVAGAPVADWHDYDTHYTERFLGLPGANPEGYKASSVLTYAKDLTVPLLVIHGTSDDNVYFMHSLKMSEALFRAGKHFEFLPLAGFTHMVPDPVVTVSLQSRIAAFFKRHLQDGQ